MIGHFTGKETSPQESFFDLFQRTNSGAHKEPLTDVFAPSITWHQAFLIPRRYRGFEQERDEAIRGIPRTVCCEGNSEKVSQDKQRRLTTDEIKPIIDALAKTFLVSLTQRRTGFKTHPYAHKTIILFDRLLDGTSEDLHELAVAPDPLKGALRNGERTFIIETSWRCFSENWNITIRIQLLTNMFNVVVIANPSNPTTIQLESRSDFERWTDSFWRRFFAFVRRCGRFKHSFSSPLFACAFTDVRGLIIPCGSLKFGTGILPPSDTFADWGRATATNLKPFVIPNPAHECSASYLLDRRALHLTALGPQPLGQSRDRRHPSTFLTCVHTHDARGKEIVGKRQLGRLVDRMQLLGTMRLAAVLDMDLLERASVRLSQIDDLKKAARASLQEYEKEIIQADDTRDSLEKLRNKMNKISSDFLEDSPAGVGLTFRIESSRYYVSQFKENLKALRLARVEGFQPYDQFVERRLGVTFEAIHRLGIRYDRAVKEMEGIDQSFESIQSRFTGNKVAEIQQFGELILLGVLVPYYLISTLAHLIEIPHEMGNKDEDILNEPSKRTIYFAIWLGWFMYALYRFWSSTREDQDWRLDIMTYGFFFFSLTTFMVWVFFSLHFASNHG